jgi:hypothetical protein
VAEAADEEADAADEEAGGLGTRNCMPMVADSFTPSWDYGFQFATASSLRTGVVFEYWDEDIASNDPICDASSLAIAPEFFKARTFTMKCDFGSVRFSIEPK